MSESLINHPKSAPRDEGGKSGDKGYLYDYVYINHNRGVEGYVQHCKQQLAPVFSAKSQMNREKSRQTTAECVWRQFGQMHG